MDQKAVTSVHVAWWYGLEGIQSGSCTQQLDGVPPHISAWTPANFDYRRAAGGAASVATAAWWPAHAGDQSPNARTITGDFASAPTPSPSSTCLPSACRFLCLSDAFPIRISSHFAEPRRRPVLSAAALRHFPTRATWAVQKLVRLSPNALATVPSR